nr:uncharacterized protein LOC127303484 [Lolium perenne]
MAIRVAAEGAEKGAEDAEKMEANGGGWYEAAEEAPAPDPRRNTARLAFHHAAEEAADVVHHREMTKLNTAIKKRLDEMTRESTEHEASARAGRRRLGDLIGRKNELIAQVATRRLLEMPSPERRAHEAGEEELRHEAEIGRQQRQRRQKGNKEARDAGLARLEALQAMERAAARKREMSSKRTITLEETERALALDVRTDRRRAAAEERQRKAARGHGPSSC